MDSGRVLVRVYPPTRSRMRAARNPRGRNGNGVGLDVRLLLNGAHDQRKKDVYWQCKDM